MPVLEMGEFFTHGKALGSEWEKTVLSSLHSAWIVDQHKLGVLVVTMVTVILR